MYLWIRDEIIGIHVRVLSVLGMARWAEETYQSLINVLMVIMLSLPDQ